MGPINVRPFLDLQLLKLRFLPDGRQGVEVAEIELDGDVVVVDDPAAVALRVHGLEHFAGGAGGVVLSGQPVKEGEG